MRTQYWVLYTVYRDFYDRHELPHATAPVWAALSEVEPTMHSVSESLGEFLVRQATVLQEDLDGWVTYKGDMNAAHPNRMMRSLRNKMDLLFLQEVQAHDRINAVMTGAVTVRKRKSRFTV